MTLDELIKKHLKTYYAGKIATLTGLMIKAKKKGENVRPYKEYINRLRDDLNHLDALARKAIKIIGEYVGRFKEMGVSEKTMIEYVTNAIYMIRGKGLIGMEEYLKSKLEYENKWYRKLPRAFTHYVKDLLKYFKAFPSKVTAYFKRKWNDFKHVMSCFWRFLKSYKPEKGFYA